jgi:hypothetical protein
VHKRTRPLALGFGRKKTATPKPSSVDEEYSAEEYSEEDDDSDIDPQAKADAALYSMENIMENRDVKTSSAADDNDDTRYVMDLVHDSMGSSKTIFTRR